MLVYILIYILFFALRFNGQIPGGPWLAGSTTFFSILDFIEAGWCRWWWQLEV